MDSFTLNGETGRISLSFEYVQCGAEGCECRGTAAIANWGMQAQGKVWFTVAGLTAFYEQLNACYQKLDGVASFATHEGNLKLDVVFERRGQVYMAGTFQEPHNEGNELKFRIVTDQSYIGQSLEGLADLVKRYGAAG